MFAKGTHFPPEKSSTIPGSGFYKLPEESRSESDKKGAFLEKVDRFGGEKSSDITGPEIYNVGPRDVIPRPGPSKPLKSNQGLTYLQEQIEALKTQNAKLLKDHQQTVKKYRNKITHNDSTIKSLVTDNVALQSHISTEQKAHRASCQREAALRAGVRGRLACLAVTDRFKEQLAKAEATTKGEAAQASLLAGMQRKFQDLEKMHSDDKKRHEAEVVQLKCELNTNRKTSSEQMELVAQFRRQEEASESRIKDLKKAILADQGEVKVLRMKVQNTAQLQSLEIKHKAEIQNQHAKLNHQEKTLTSESRRREKLEQLVDTLKSDGEQDAQKARDRICSLRGELSVLTRSFAEAQTSAAEERRHLVDVRATLVLVAEAYGHLAASSVSIDSYRQIESQCATLRLRNIRLERRLADRDALVEQLTDYCRQASEERNLFAKDLRELEDDQRMHLRRHYPDHPAHSEDMSLIYNLFGDYCNASQQQDSIMQADLQFATAIGGYYEANFNNLLVAYAMTYQGNMEQKLVVDRLINQCTALQTEAETLRLHNSTAEVELSRKSVQIAEAASRERALNEQLQAHKGEIGKLKDTLERERQTGERLVRASHQSKKNEECLRLEVDELIANLADLTRYKEAHADLLAEVVALIERNELAEAEAEQLGIFNAEILGHTNPNQKIFYVDRIRRELADTKHQLLKSTRDRDDLAADNAALQHEMAAYKSIAVPLEQKLGGTRVRIERPPLTARSINESIPNIALEVTPPLEDPIDTAPMTVNDMHYPPSI